MRGSNQILMSFLAIFAMFVGIGYLIKFSPSVFYFIFGLAVFFFVFHLKFRYSLSLE